MEELSMYKLPGLVKISAIEAKVSNRFHYFNKSLCHLADPEDIYFFPLFYECSDRG
jgi:hypothetical protein